MTRKVSLSPDTLDNLFRDMLVDDYRNVRTSVKNLEALGELKEFQQEDLDNDRRIMAAMEELLKYYIYIGDALEIINENTTGE